MTDSLEANPSLYGDGDAENWGHPESNLIEFAEVERKFLAEPGSSLPDFKDIRGVHSVGSGSEFELNALYFDTPALLLTKTGGSLRRRSGGEDAGWHLKLKGSGQHERKELRAPIVGARPPLALRDALGGELAESPLVPIARLRTIRRETPLYDRHGRALALVCEDSVWVQSPSAIFGSGEEQRWLEKPPSWQELEIELVTGNADLLEQISVVLLADGFLPALYKSKIAQAIAILQQAALAGPSAVDELNVPHGAAARVVLDFAATQTGLIQALEQRVRDDEDDAVHQSRVACRRLRSLLRTFEPLFDSDFAENLQTELQWHGAALGAARDAEVVRGHLVVSMEEICLPADSPLRVALISHLDEMYEDAHREALAAMLTPRYEMLHDALNVLLSDPPLTSLGRTGDATVLAALLNVQRAKTSRRYLAALRSTEDPDLWHSVRKSAKALRYAFEAIRIGEFPGAWLQATLWENVSDALGQVQDSAVALQTLEADAKVIFGLPAKDRNSATGAADLGPQDPAQLEYAKLLRYETDFGSAKLRQAKKAIRLAFEDGF